MHKGVFIGKDAANQDKRILILGESHHISNDPESENRTFGVPASYKTKDVVLEHINDIENEKKSLRFFQKIGQSFGYPMKTKEEKEAFWNQVYFGNYIDVLCGIKDDAAKNYLKKGNNRRRMNDDLFQFINENEIDVIVCFGRLIMEYLPSLNPEYKKEEDGGKLKAGEIFTGGKRDYIENCIYIPDIEHKNSSVTLKKRLEAYGLRHPSAQGGFCAENYKDVLSVLLK